MFDNKTLNQRIHYSCTRIYAKQKTKNKEIETKFNFAVFFQQNFFFHIHITFDKKKVETNS